MRKPIILIGGASGCGKTTLARQLCHALDIDHWLSTGFIREILREQMSPAAYPWLFSYTFAGADPVDTLVRQAEMLARYVGVVIRRAREEGTSLIMEGNHIVPSMYCNTSCDLYVTITMPPLHQHQGWLRGGSHARRHMTEADLRGARIIGEYLESEAAAFNVPLVPYEVETQEILRLLPVRS